MKKILLALAFIGCMFAAHAQEKPSTGEWFLWEYSSILSGIRIPAAQDPWA